MPFNSNSRKLFAIKLWRKSKPVSFFIFDKKLIKFPYIAESDTSGTKVLYKIM